MHDNYCINGSNAFLSYFLEGADAINTDVGKMLTRSPLDADIRPTLARLRKQNSSNKKSKAKVFASILDVPEPLFNTFTDSGGTIQYSYKMTQKCAAVFVIQNISMTLYTVL